MTQGRFDGTHGSVLNVHTGASRADCLSDCLSILSHVSLSSLMCLSVVFQQKKKQRKVTAPADTQRQTPRPPKHSTIQPQRYAQHTTHKQAHETHITHYGLDE